MTDVYENMELDYEFDSSELKEKENVEPRWESILAKLQIKKKAIKMPTMESILAEEEEEEERKILRKIQDAVAEKMKPAFGSSAALPTAEEKAEADTRSVYVGNVDYSVKSVDLEAHFVRCGPISRVTIPTDKFCGRPKGFAYIEFTDKKGAQNSFSLTGSYLKGRHLNVIAKRTNKPGMSTINRKPLGSGGVQRREPAPVVVKYIYVGNRPSVSRTLRR